MQNSSYSPPASKVSKKVVFVDELNILKPDFTLQNESPSPLTPPEKRLTRNFEEKESVKTKSSSHVVEKTKNP